MNGSKDKNQSFAKIFRVYCKKRKTPFSLKINALIEIRFFANDFKEKRQIHYLPHIIMSFNFGKKLFFKSFILERQSLIPNLEWAISLRIRFIGS